MPNWPPPVEGPKATATRWWARLHEGALVLARTSNLGDADLVPVVHLPLAGCRCLLPPHSHNLPPPPKRSKKKEGKRKTQKI